MIYLWAVLFMTGTLAALATMLVVAERCLLNYGPCTVRLEGRDEPIRVMGGLDLRSVLRQAEMLVPSMCAGKGTCGHCKVTVLTGGGPVLATERLSLSEEEISSGARLACQLRIRNDVRVRLPSEFLSATRYRAEVSSVMDLTATTKEIRLRLLAPPRMSFLPGQYVQVEIPAGGPEPVYRAYSIASPTYETAEIALVVERVPGGVGSTWLHRLRVGQVVRFSGPYGEFRINEDPAVEVVCVAGGCGLAPMKSIIYTVLDRWPGRACSLFYGCRNPREAFGLRMYERLAKQYPNFHLVCAISDGPDTCENWPGETGFIHRSLERHLAPGTRRQAYVCGPPAMLRAVTEVLRRKGTWEIFFDRFDR